MSDYIRSVTTIPLPPQTAMPILDFEVRNLTFICAGGRGRGEREKSVLIICIFPEGIRHEREISNAGR
jgi:hypothetical protein